MSANLGTTNGIVAMAYAGARPWHGQGQIIETGDDFDTVARKCGFGFEIHTSPAGYLSDEGVFRKADNRVVTYRSDTGTPIGIVGDGYRVHQPREILDFFFTAARDQHMTIETAGVLGGGERYWALARTGVDVKLGGVPNGARGGDDRALLYALLCTAADGTMATIATPTAIRVVCANTWRVAIRDAERAQRGSRQRHTSAFNAELAARGLGFDIDGAARELTAMATTLGNASLIPVSPAQATGFFRTLLRPELAETVMGERPDTPATALLDVMTLADFQRAFDASSKVGDDGREPKEVRGVASLMESYYRAPGAIPGTVRGLYEAVTHNVDHVRGNDDSVRMESATTGAGARLKDRAFDAITHLAMVSA